MDDVDLVPDPEGVMTILTIISPYEDDEVCDSPILVVESGFDRTEVDEVLDYRWREDRIECRSTRAGDGSEMLATEPTTRFRSGSGHERLWATEFVVASGVIYHRTISVSRAIPGEDGVMSGDPIDRQCVARSTRSGERCKKYAIRGATVCGSHGGRAPQVKRAAAKRVIVEQATKLGLSDGQPIDDPVGALMDLGGEAVALVTALKSHVAELERVGTTPGRWGEQVKPEIAAYLGAIREAERILTSIVRLNLAERLVRIDEARAEIVVKVIERVLTSAGIDSQAIDVRASVAHELNMVAG